MTKLKEQVPQKYGKLLTNDIKIYRNYFIEMTKLWGFVATYKNPTEGSKDYTAAGELRSNYTNQKEIGCILEEHPDQKTLKKLGWFSESSEPIIVYLPYDTEGLQKGTIITLPSAIEGAADRTFKVNELSTIMIYPASIACSVSPEYETNIDFRETHDFSAGDFTMLKPTDSWGKEKSWEVQDLKGEEFD